LEDVEFLEENTIDRQLFFLLQHTEIVKEKEEENQAGVISCNCCFFWAGPVFFL